MDRILNFPSCGNDWPLTAIAFDMDVLTHLLAMGDDGLSSVLKEVNMHDIALLPNAARMRTAALAARLEDGALSLSGELSTLDGHQPHPGQTVLREYAPFIEQLQLRRLDLACNGITCADGNALRHVLSNQPHLCHLDLSGNADMVLAKIMPVIQSMTSLTLLGLSQCNARNEQQVLLPISHLSHLAHLDMLHCPIPAAERRKAARIFKQLSALTHLQLGSFERLDLSFAAALTHHLSPCMRHLTLSWGPTPWADRHSFNHTASATFADGLCRLTALTYLSLGYPNNTYDDHEWIDWPRDCIDGIVAALATLPHLSHFRASRLSLQPEVFSHLAAATHLRHLTAIPRFQAHFPQPTQLISLHIHIDPGRIGASPLLRHLKPLTALRSLHINQFIADLPAVQALCSTLASAAASLADLELGLLNACIGGVAVSSAPGLFASSIAQLTGLTRLSVCDWHLLGDSAPHLVCALRPLRALCHLKVARIDGHSVPAVQALPPEWSPWGGFGNAVSAGQAGSGSYVGTKNSAQSVGAALGSALAAMTGLSELWLDGLEVPGAAEMIGALGALGALQDLILIECGLGKTEAMALASLLRGGAFPLLETLDLNSNKLTSAAVVELAGGLPYVRRLQHLSLRLQNGITYDSEWSDLSDQADEEADQEDSNVVWEAAQSDSDSGGTGFAGGGDGSEGSDFDASSREEDGGELERESSESGSLLEVGGGRRCGGNGGRSGGGGCGHGG